MSTSFPATLPPDLPVPFDDGACDNLPGKALPGSDDSGLVSCSSGQIIDLFSLDGQVVLFIYPSIGAAGSAPSASWNAIPGARGCTLQTCSFRDVHKELLSAGASSVYGLSVQSVEFSKEAKERLHLPFDLLCDEELKFAKALGMPTFEYEGRELYKRACLIVEKGKVKKVFYPVFPPDKSADVVLEWLKSQ